MKKLPIELQNSDSFLGIVEHAGNSYAVIDVTDFPFCDGCFFDCAGMCFAPRNEVSKFICSSLLREDNKSVIFKKL